MQQYLQNLMQKNGTDVNSFTGAASCADCYAVLRAVVRADVSQKNGTNAETLQKKSADAVKFADTHAESRAQIRVECGRMPHNTVFVPF